MRLWRKCWQVPGIYGQPERHRGQSGSSQGSHGNTPSQEQEGATPHSKLVALGRFIARFFDELRPFFLAIRKVEHKDGRTIAKPLSKRSSIVLCNHPS
ncbi:hypothetical protein AAG906_036933 [Vitis piasezkii]